MKKATWMDDYLDILREWQQNVAKPFVYEHLDDIFPSFQFRRLCAGSPDRDHWASRYKMDGTLPKARNAEKTVIYRSTLHFHEQGDWEASAKSLFDMMMEQLGLPDIAACNHFLDERYGLGMPQPNDPEVRGRVGEREKKNAVLDDLMDYFSWNLQNNPSEKAKAVRRYLQGQRGFSKQQLTELHLGFVPDWGTVMRYIVSKKGHSLEALDAACGVRNADGKTSVGKTHTLAIPYECAGVLKGFIFRTVGKVSGPKYIATQDLDRKSVFFNMPSDSSPKEIIVVEGEFDALKATAEGIRNVVAIGGSEIAGERRAQIEDALFRRGVSKITLCLDLDAEKDDPAKPKTAERFQHIMRSIHTIKDAEISFDEIYVASFPSPSDPDEYIRENGADAFRKLLGDAVPYWKYLFDYKESK